MLNTIKGNEWLTCVVVLYNDLIAFHHICIEAMEWLTVSHHHIVGNINDVIDRTKSDNRELFLEPFW